MSQKKNIKGFAVPLLVGAIATAGALAVVVGGGTQMVAKLAKESTTKDTSNIYLKQGAFALTSETSDSDGDGFHEALVMAANADGTGVCAGGSLVATSTTACYIPSTSSAPKGDAWGSAIKYCSFDNGTTNTSAGRITGTNPATGASITFALVSAGPNKAYDTTCASAAVGTASGDDVVYRFSGLQITQGVSGTQYWGDPVANSAGLASLDPAQQKDGEARVQKDTGQVYRFDAGYSSWKPTNGVTSVTGTGVGIGMATLPAATLHVDKGAAGEALRIGGTGDQSISFGGGPSIASSGNAVDMVLNASGQASQLTLKSSGRTLFAGAADNAVGALQVKGGLALQSAAGADTVRLLPEGVSYLNTGNPLLINTGAAIDGATALQINGGVTSNGTIKAAYLLPTTTVTLGNACTTNGAIAQSSTGQALSCVSGTWLAPGFWNLNAGGDQYNTNSSGAMLVNTAVNDGAGAKLQVSGDTSLTGSLRLNGVARRILADLSNAADANRLLLQSSTVNGDSYVGVIPNGTATTSAFVAYNNANPAAGNAAILRATATAAELASTGVLPITISPGGVERARVDSSGLLVQDSEFIGHYNGAPQYTPPSIFDGLVDNRLTIASSTNSPALSLGYYSVGYGLDIWVGTTGLAPIYFDNRNTDSFVWRGNTRAGGTTTEYMRLSSTGVSVNGVITNTGLLYQAIPGGTNDWSLQIQRAATANRSGIKYAYADDKMYLWSAGNSAIPDLTIGAGGSGIAVAGGLSASGSISSGSTITAAPTSGFVAGNFYAYDASSIVRIGSQAGSPTIRMQPGTVSVADFTPTGLAVTGGLNVSGLTSVGTNFGAGLPSNALNIVISGTNYGVFYNPAIAVDGGGVAIGGTSSLATTPTTATMFWNVNTNKVGIGTTNPTDTLTVNGGISGNSATINGTLYNSYKGVNSVGSNIWIGGGGQLSYATSGAVGYQGSHNTSLGVNAMPFNTTGYYNTASGYFTLSSNTTGYYNTANGANALYSNTTGYANTASGMYALYSNTTGVSNTAFGYYALLNSTGGGNIAIGGMNSGGSYAPAYNITTENNYISMGSTTVTNAYIQVAWTVVSDARDKMNFNAVPHGLDFVRKLKPLSYQFKMSRNDPTPNGRVRYGFLAQDILAIEGANGVIIDNTDANKLRFNEADLIPVLVNGIQELDRNLELTRGKVDKAISDSNDWAGNVIPVAKGGTGLVTAPGVGQIMIGNGTGYTLSRLDGVANQINVTHDADGTHFALADDVRVHGKLFASSLSLLADAQSITNTAAIDGALAKATALKGVYGDMNGRRQLLFVAQDAEAVIPELVDTNPDGLKTIGYTGVLPVLVEAVKELHAKVGPLYPLAEKLSVLADNKNTIRIDAPVLVTSDFTAKTVTAEKIVADEVQGKNRVFSDALERQIVGGGYADILDVPAQGAIVLNVSSPDGRSHLSASIINTGNTLKIASNMKDGFDLQAVGTQVRLVNTDAQTKNAKASWVRTQ